MKGLLLVAALLLVAGTARAHELDCEKTVSVDGVDTHVVREYPATIEYEIVIRNTHPTAASDVLFVHDTLAKKLGIRLRPTPYTLPLGASFTQRYEVTVDSFEECRYLAAHDGRVDTYLDNVFRAGWDAGETQCRARVICLRPTCDSDPTTDLPPCPTCDSDPTTDLPPCPTCDSDPTTDLPPCPTCDADPTTELPPCPTCDEDPTTDLPPCEPVCDEDPTTGRPPCPTCDEDPTTDLPPCEEPTCDEDPTTDLPPCPTCDEDPTTDLPPCEGRD